ncbi:MAG: IS1595 family transposase [Hyphomonadaceae bacterium]
MKTNLTAPHFTNEEAARTHYEAIRWPDGRVCPHCGTVGNSVLLQGKSTRPGLYKCRDCRKPFTATMGTIYERSHIPLHKWLLATHIMCSSKKGVSAHQLWRMLGFGSYKTAWFMAHRIREAMREGDLAPFGSDGGDVELDETFLLRDPDARPTPKNARGTSWVEKMKVLTLIDRSTGRSRSFQIEDLKAETIFPIIRANIAKEARFLTDEAARYSKIGREFAAHGVVNHSKDEYVSKDDPTIHVNCAEGFFSVFKRGMRGVYQHCGKQHLHRYVAEFDFRYSHRMGLGVDDNARAEKALKGTVGRRLTYRPLAGSTAQA